MEWKDSHMPKFAAPLETFADCQFLRLEPMRNHHCLQRWKKSTLQKKLHEKCLPASSPFLLGAGDPTTVQWPEENSENSLVLPWKIWEKEREKNVQVILQWFFFKWNFKEKLIFKENLCLFLGKKYPSFESFASRTLQQHK